ncbi:MAG: hypothetical protein Q9169_002691 [Polycauliona sp. 2 TL-2023]
MAPPFLPRLVCFPPFISQPVLSLQTATGTISPASPIGSDMQRSRSKRLTRVKELLTPIRDSNPHMAPRDAEEAVDTEEIFIKLEPSTVGSQIEFFARHPEDSTNPLTFLDGSSGDGTGDTTTGTAAGETASAKEVETVSPGESSPKSSLWASVFSASSAGPGSDLLAELRSSDSDECSTPIPILKAPRVLTGEDRTRPRYPQREHILRTRPVTLHEMPGRFNSNATCWYCCDGVVGERCEVCGLVVRKASPERWG